MKFGEKCSDPGLEVDIVTHDMIVIRDLMFKEEVIVPIETIPTLIAELNRLYKGNN